MGTLNKGLKKPFALEKQSDNVLKFETFWKLKCSSIGLSCNSSKWIATIMQLFLIPYCLSYLSILWNIMLKTLTIFFKWHLE